jgi:chromosome segregation ATPase
MDNIRSDASEKFRVKIDDLEAMIRELRREIECKNQQLEALKNKAESVTLKDTVINDLSDQLNTLKASVRDRECQEKRLSILESDNRELQEILTEKDEHIQYITSEIEGIKRQFETNLEDVRREIKSESSDEISQLQENLAIAANALKEQETIIQEYSKSIKQLTELVESLNAEKENISVTNAQQRQRLSEISSLLQQP